jgi:hypothetical protein
MSGKGFGEVRAKPHQNFAEEQQNQTKQRNGNDGRNAQMGCLAETAIWFVMAAGVRVRHDLQQKENGNQRQRKGDKRSQPAISPGIR